MASYGRFTQVDLADLGFLSRENPAGMSFNREAARFALELAAVAYDFSVDRWLDAGGPTSPSGGREAAGGVALPQYADRPLVRACQRVAAAPRQAPHRFPAGHQAGPGVLWKPTPQQTGKAITMIRAMEDGRFAVIIGFMGTGKRRMDWESNFRLAHPEGYHQGFLDLTRQFEENSGRIQFEQTAQLLGRPSLSLQDVLGACREKDSRFVLFAAGHSQGAAVLQLWMLRRLSEGVLPGNMAGYGFASPSVAALPHQGRELALYHLINSDDLVPRVGLFYHLGRSFVYHAHKAFRDYCYCGWNSHPLFMRQLGMVKDHRGTMDMLALLIAYLEALSRMEQDKVAEAVALIAGGGFAERMLLKRDEPLAGVLRLMGRMLRRHYELAGGAPVDEKATAALADTLIPMIEEEGAENFTRMMLQVMSVPHALVFRDATTPGLAPYAYMVLRGYADLMEVDP